MGVTCPDFDKVFDRVLQGVVISNLEKPGREETIILGQCTAGWEAVVREQLPMINCGTERGALRSVLGQECRAVFSLAGGMGESRGFLFSLQAGTGCRPGGEWVQNAK